MKSKASIVLASLFAAFVTVACSDSPSPAAPSPTPAPSPSEPAPPSPNPPAPTPPTPTPGPSTPTPTPPPAPTPPPSSDPMSFVADAPSPSARSFSLQAAEMVEGDLYVTLYAQDFGADTVNMVRATISYDPAVVNPVSFSSKDSWMESFGYQAAFQVTKSGGNLIKVRVDLNTSSGGASGSGGILRLRFRKIAPGSTRLEFTEGHAYDAGFNESLQAMYGGTIVVK